MATGVALAAGRRTLAEAAVVATPTALHEFGYDQVAVTGTLQTSQRENVLGILNGFSDDSLLQPFRQMTGKPGPGTSLGGWYEWKADYDYTTMTPASAGHSFGCMGRLCCFRLKLLMKEG